MNPAFAGFAYGFAPVVLTVSASRRRLRHGPLTRKRDPRVRPLEDRRRTVEAAHRSRSFHTQVPGLSSNAVPYEDDEMQHQLIYELSQGNTFCSIILEGPSIEALIL